MFSILLLITALIKSVPAGVVVSNRAFIKPYVTPSTCLTIGCIDVASFIAQNANLSANPCEDFYEFSCGKFRARTIVSENDEADFTTLVGSVSITDGAESLIKNVAQELLLQNTSMVLTNAEQNFANYYKACLGYNEQNSDEFSANSTDFVLKLAKNFGGFKLTNPRIVDDSQKTGVSSWNLEELLAMSLDFNATTSTPLFSMTVARDSFNPQINTLTLSPVSTIFFGDRSTFENATSDLIANMTANYVEFLMNFADIILPTNGSYNLNSLESLVFFEYQLANMTPPVNISALDYEMGSDDMLNVTLVNLKKICPALNWTRLFRLVGERYNITALKGQSLTSLKVTVTSVSFFRQLSSFLKDGLLNTTMGQATLQNYIILSSLQSYFPKLSTSLSGLYTNFTASLAASDNATTSRSGGCVSKNLQKDICFDESKSVYGLAVSRRFVEKIFTHLEKRALLTMAEDIRGAFLQKTVRRVSWLDEATRRQLTAKAKGLIFSMGYPEEAIDLVALDRHYSDYGTMSTDDYLNNLLKVNKGSSLSTFKMLDKPGKRIDWSDMTPMDVNAENDQGANVVLFPAANAIEPLFRLDFPKSFVWGSIGAATLAHEFNHAFDASGMHYGAHGEILVNGWSKNETVLASYDELTDCLILKYSEMKPLPETDPNAEIDGELTKHETFADNGGLAVAYEAFVNSIGHDISNEELPGLALTNEQVFFLSLGMSYCSKETTAAEMTYLSDPHPPNKIRVNAMMMNSAAFSEAFSCPSSSAMNPVDKCELWK